MLTCCAALNLEDVLEAAVDSVDSAISVLEDLNAIAEHATTDARRRLLHMIRR